MPLPSDYISGTITLTNGSVDFTGTGTGWLAADFREGDIILDIAGGGGRVAVVQSITGNASGTLSKVWDGPTLTGVAYRIRYQWDSSRVSAQTRTMIEKLGNGNLESFSGVAGPGVVVMDGPHSVIVKPESDFVNGVAYDVQVDTLPDRAAYDGQSVGFAVLVSNIGDGRSAVYSKASNTVADWTDPAYVTGPVGPASDLEFSATPLPPGSSPTVTQTPVLGGYEVELGIPSGRGMTPRGTYNPATAYVLDDSVLDNGSTWIALQPTTGNAPPTLPTTSNAYWQLLARKGTDGAGTGDVVGPVSAVDERVAVFDGATGKLLKDGGKTLAELGGGKFTKLPEVSYSANRTVTAADAGIMQAFGSTLPMTATLPSLSSSNDEVYNFLNDGSANLTVVPSGSDDIEGNPSLVLNTGSIAMVWPNSAGDGWRAVVSKPAPASEEVIIFSGKLTSLPTWDLKDLDGVKSLEIIGDVRSVNSGAGVRLGLRTSSDNGVTFADGGSDYSAFTMYAVQSGSGPAQIDGPNSSYIPLHSTSSLGSAANEGASFRAVLTRLNELAFTKMIVDYVAIASSGGTDFGFVRGRRLSNTVTNAIRIFCTSGNLAEVDLTVKAIY